jgi:hypothetical protein
LKLETRPIFVMGRVILVCMLVGTIIGARGRQILIGVVAGVGIGVFLGGAYHVLLPSIGWYALGLTWLLFWIFFGLLETLLQESRGVALAVIASAGAAVLSALVYYALGRSWGQPSSADPNYLRVLIIWSSAFFPGFIVLFWRRG